MKTLLFCFTLFSNKLFANSNLQYSNDPLSMWIALFGLAFIAILALFLSSEKIRNLKKNLEQEELLKESIQKQHNTIISNMGENIHSLAEGNRDAAKKLSLSNNISSINEDINHIEDSESKLLSIASNLIEFLRLKSKKVDILNEKISFSNLLNDVSGTLKEIIKHIPLELHYILDKDIKENIYGDTLNLSKVLLNIILYCIDNKSEKILLHISSTTNFSKTKRLVFTFATHLKIDAHNQDAIFTANYNDKTGTYESLGLFVARELCQLMDGKLIARNDNQGNLEFLFDIEYKEVQQNQTSPSVETKKVLIVDESLDAANSCKNIFQALGHNVTSMPVQEYLYNVSNFSHFDLIILDEKLFTTRTLSKIRKTDKIISVSNLFSATAKNLNRAHTNLSLQKPLTKKHTQELLENIYLTPSKENPDIQKTSHTTKLPIYKDTFVDYQNVTLVKFSKFRDVNVLLVEDNFINQKVFLGILGKSGMNITVAENGQEALDILCKNKEFHIIFMDINMPVMDGFTTSKLIREDIAYDSIPIIALTALTSRAEINSMFSTGMNAYLAKPLRKAKLYSAFSMFISDKKDERRQSIRYEERIIKLNGLNVGVGINNSNSNDFFYKEILKEFQDAYGESDSVFTKLVEDSRYEQLRLLCLDMRGLSASIGAEDMSLLAGEVLKLLLFKKYDILKDFVTLYTKSLQRLNNSIEEYLSA